MRGNVVAVVVALGVGLGGGYLIGARPGSTPAPPTATFARDESVEPGQRDDDHIGAPTPTSPVGSTPSGGASPAASSLATAPTAPPTSAAGDRAASDAGECDALRAEVARLHQVVAAEHALREDTEGKPIAFPDDLDPRYRAPALLAGFSAAAKSVGADAAEVEDIDCSELPCLVHGSLPAGDATGDATRAKLESLMDTMEAGYQGSGKWLTASTFEPPKGQKGETYVRFTLSFYPQPAEGSPEQEALNKRMHFRRDQYDASAPGAPE